MTALVTGANGRLGRAVARVFMTESEVVRLGRTDLDVTDRNAVHAAVAGYRPSVVINCAAWTDVDGCELDPERAQRTNADAPRFLQEACDTSEAHLVHLSTDYVFDGAASIPYREDDPTGPLSVYGATKLEGEKAAGPTATVIRTSWLQTTDAPSMVDRFLRQLEEPGPVRVPADRQASPTFVDDLASMVSLLAADRYAGSRRV